MKLNKLLRGISYSGYIVPENLDIKNIAYDSRLVNNQSCFVAIKGERFDGHNFIFEALKRGAKIIVIDDEKFIDKNFPIIKVESTRKALSKISRHFFSNPSKLMKVAGIT